MKGVINNGIQELCEAQFGAEAWEQVKNLAECEEPFFALSEDYPDEMTLRLVQAVSEVSGWPVETVLVEFGKFWIPNTGKETYPSLFRLAGSTPREFLRSVNRVHEQVARTTRPAALPRVSCEELPDGRLLLHYHSERGLCPVLRGLILGVGVYFHQELQVREMACRQQGEPHCTMEVTFP